MRKIELEFKSFFLASCGGKISGEMKFGSNMITVSYALKDGGYVVYQGTETGGLYI
jgi:hypothetical protein